MAADRGISPTRARRLAHHLEQAAHEIEREGRAATHELAAVGWAAPPELAALAGLHHRLHASARDIRKRADDVEHQKVRPSACAGAPRRHATNPLIGFGKGILAGATATVAGLTHVVVDVTKTPVQMAGAAIHGGSPATVVERKAWANVHAMWQSRTTFWHSGLAYLVIETHRHGLSRALDEFAYANGAVIPFAAVTAATWGGGSSAMAGVLRGAGVPATTAARTATVVNLTNPAPPVTADERCDREKTAA